MNITNLPKNIILLISTFLTSKYILRSVCKKFNSYIPIYNLYNIPNNINKINILKINSIRKIQIPDTDILKIKSSYMFIHIFPKYIRRLVIDEDSGYEALNEVEQIDELLITCCYVNSFKWSQYGCFDNLKFIKMNNLIIKKNIETKVPIICETVEVLNEGKLSIVNIDIISCLRFENFCYWTKITNLNINYSDRRNIYLYINSPRKNHIIDTLTFIGFLKLDYKNSLKGLEYVKNIQFKNCSEEFIEDMSKICKFIN